MDDLTRWADLKVDTTIAVHVPIDWFLTMGQGKKQKGKSGKARETSRREEPDTARAGEADEPSTSQEPEDPFDAGNSGDEDTSTPQLSKPFTDRQDKQIAAFFGQHPCFYDDPSWLQEQEEERCLDQAVCPVHVHEW